MDGTDNFGVDFETGFAESPVPVKGTLTGHLLPVRHRADLRALAFVGVLLGLYAAQLSGLLRHAGLVMVSGILSFAVMVVRHNHIHYAVFTRRRWNTGFDLLLSLLTVQATDGVVAIHNERHHGQNHSEEDCVRSTLVRHRRNWVNLLSFFFVAAGTARRKKARDVRRWRAREPRRYRKYLAEQSAAVAVVGLLLLLDWKAACLYFLLPVLAGHWCIVTINLLQHQGCEHASAFNHSRNVTGRFINWLFLNNGFHTAHHLEPGLHWSRLPDLHRAVVEPNSAPHLHTNSLAVALWRQFFAPRKP